MKPVYIEIDDVGNKFYHRDRAMKIFHREDGPAIEWVDGSKSWYRNGKLHREDGPAGEYASGTKVWSIDGLKHREDGPAIERADGSNEWWVNGKQVTEEEHARLTAKEIVLSMEEIAAKFGISVEKLKIQK